MVSHSSRYEFAVDSNGSKQDHRSLINHEMNRSRGATSVGVDLGFI